MRVAAPLPQGMGFTIWTLLKAGLLVLNAFAVLHPERFLRKRELVLLFGVRNLFRTHTAPVADGLDGVSGAEAGGIKHQLSGLFTASRFMRCECVQRNRRP